jgi:hypothetical protein
MEFVALALSIVALAVAGLTALRMRKLEFCPEIVGGDVILPRESRQAAGCACSFRCISPTAATPAASSSGSRCA